MNQHNDDLNVCRLGKAGLGMTVDYSFFIERRNTYQFNDPITGCLYVIDAQPIDGKTGYMTQITNDFLKR